MDSAELGHFSLLEKIGEGGMGQVYKARDTRLGRLVAIKLLAEARQEDAGRRARFIQEAKAASALNHPNIITIHEVGEQDGRTFIVMELVEGKPLNELIPAKGMRLTEALRIAAQVAGALTTAHAAGIVHRDLKPANIMVDAHGRVKVLDFGLAKLSAPAALVAVEADEGTRTLVLDQPVTEEGMIVGSVPYMSPEQAEGKPVDARSDIFSFGAVLYEMITGQRAFRGESRVSTLAAVLERDPQPPSEISSTTPPELERLITRCLRKDVNRRSQSMADVKLALEELRDESESGKLARPALTAGVGARRWLWPVAIASVLIAAAAFTWFSFSRRGIQSKVPELVRVSPHDGHSYTAPAISPDGGFVAYVSDRSGNRELWLQQVGGGDPIHLTHSNESVAFPAFFPGGKRILYVTTSVDNRESAINVISALGGDPQVLIQGWRIMNWAPMLSPDGRQIAYFDDNQDARLMTISSNGGQPRELPAWARTPHQFYGRAAWTSDSRYLLCLMSKKSEATNAEEPEWFAFPVDGANPSAMGAADAARVAGLTLKSAPILMAGDRALFVAGTTAGNNIWEIRLSAGSWHVQGAPHQLTFGTLVEMPYSISATDTVALQVGDYPPDLYLIPLSSATGQPTGVVRRLTHDGRHKEIEEYSAGHPGSAYFSLETDSHPYRLSYYAVDLNSGKQTLVASSLPLGLRHLRISPDGRQVAYSVAEGDSYSIRVIDAGADSADARVLCKACGSVYGFSPDGRFLFYDPGARVKDDPKRKLTVRLLEVASGKDSLWIEAPTNSVVVTDTVALNSGWLVIGLEFPGSHGPMQGYLVPWKQAPVPQSEWVRIPLPDRTGNAHPWRASPLGDFLYLFEGLKLMAIRFDPQRVSLSEPYEVKFVPGSAMILKPDDDWTVRGPGLVFSRQETGTPSVWLMKLPR
jgi:Tol biopolymer transport system component/tRNA A-37 threonylcarbamoyl transferase component Bud32